MFAWITEDLGANKELGIVAEVTRKLRDAPEPLSVTPQVYNLCSNIGGSLRNARKSEEALKVQWIVWVVGSGLWWSAVITWCCVCFLDYGVVDNCCVAIAAGIMEKVRTSTLQL